MSIGVKPLQMIQNKTMWGEKKLNQVKFKINM
jgi:hypothetical protein